MAAGVDMGTISPIGFGLSQNFYTLFISTSHNRTMPTPFVLRCRVSVSKTSRSA